MRTCKVCGTQQPLEDFPKITSNPLRYRYECKPCYRVKCKQYRDDNIDRFREQWRGASKKYQANPANDFKRRLRKYGLTQEQYDKMYSDQNGLCGICKAASIEVIDHCHDSSKVRGLLCTPCNLLLGNAKDNVDTLRAAVLYLNM